jgi:hypothetical protein
MGIGIFQMGFTGFGANVGVAWFVMAMKDEKHRRSPA